MPSGNNKLTTKTMLERRILSVDDLKKKLCRDISTIFNLAKSDKIPLWIDFEDTDVECYRENPDGSMMLVNTAYFFFKPAPEVLDSLLMVHNQESDLPIIDDKTFIEIAERCANTPITPKKVGYSQRQRQKPVDLDPHPKQFADAHKNGNKLLYLAFPALDDDGLSITLKQLIRIKRVDRDGNMQVPKTNDATYRYHIITLGFNDLFAYEDDVNEYLRSLKEDYCISKKALCESLGVSSFNTVVKWVRQAGFKLDRKKEGNVASSPMLKHNDVAKVKAFMKKNKNNKK